MLQNWTKKTEALTVGSRRQTTVTVTLKQVAISYNIMYISDAHEPNTKLLHKLYV